MPFDASAVYGQTNPTSGQGEWNQLRFSIMQMISRMQTALPVKIMAVNAGGLGPVGTVDIQILTQQLTGDDQPITHGVISNVPYVRIQGGGNAVIIDPAVGDIGMAVFASRDISGVKSTKSISPPSSRRQYDFSDAMYIGGLLNATPTQYIQFLPDDGGIVIHSPNSITVNAPNAEVQCAIGAINASSSVTVTAPVAAVNAATSATISSASVSLGTGGTLRQLIDDRFISLFNGHTHPDADGGNTGTPNQTAGSGELTSATRAN